ncbi:heavy metal translocating P-type ATPase [Enterovirga rhinocerotis]|uniref:P-type Zn(2+) transporter n=1 Tax=Enterovirga rhinocerotis TaxID=1339210 RepID=A0A4R7BW76_9HYPH|nr:heavy metal translocating P-type ATPase [Enterovirga rhinocerotis]TDR89811.1 Cd2+/Zn2+-exporting ATPase [Enterovirga rhinocerotis]
MTEVTARSRYRIEGMDCAACAAKITTAVRRVPGVADVSVSVAAGTMTVEHDDSPALGAAVIRQVQSLGGYEATALSAPSAEAASPDDAEAGCCGGHDHGHDHAHGHGHGHGHDGDAPAEDRGHGAAGHVHGLETSAGPWWRSAKARLTFASGLAFALAWIAAKAVPGYEQWLYAAAVLVGLVPIARRAVAAARIGMPFTIEMLMTIAAIGALIIGAAEEAAAVVFLFLIGEMLEGVAAGRARASIQGLAALVPKTALVEEGGATTEVPAERLAIGSVILVRPGDRIAADGEVVAGEGAVDEAPVTGESTPKRKVVGDAVFAGTINADSVLRVRVTAAAADNTIARVVKLVEEAQESKAPTERFIDRFSTWYTPGVVVVAALVAVLPPLLAGQPWGEWIYKGLAILLIGCPCALVISTPAAIAAALSAGARRGLLMKGGAVLEGIGRIEAIALDKTGTLTEGRPKVTDLIAFGRPEAEVLSLAAALEGGSSHPLALAILGRAKEQALPVPQASDAAALGGKGVTGTVGGERVFLGSPAAAAERAALSDDQRASIERLNGEGKTVSVLLVDDVLAGLVAMRDEPRADAKAGLEALKAAGIEPVMLTGDNRLTAEAIGRDLGLPVRSELLPQDKQRIVREIQASGKRVAKVGDGINDAPALAAADIGIAMGGGTDVALETADAAVLHGRVLDLARMVELSRRTMGNIHQNIAIALGLKAVFLVTTVVGLTGLWPAILADTGATVLVTANAMRLLTWR